MTDREAMLAAIRANPDEDTPRLIHADWLDEHGDGDRAAFIRAQIEAVRSDPFGVQARNASKHAGELLEKNRAPWHSNIREAIQGQLEDFVGVQVSGMPANALRDVVQVKARFERGFVGHVTLHPSVFVRVATGIFAAEPIQSLELQRFTAQGETPLQPVFELPQLQHLRRLEFARLQGITEDEYAALLGCQHLSNLRDLWLCENPVPPPWVVELLGGEGFPELQGLFFRDIPNLGPGLVNALTRANHRNIRRLDVSGVVFHSEPLRQLLTSRCLRGVEELRLGCVGRPGSPGPLSHINPGWVIPYERLVILDLDGQRLGNEGVGDIVRQPTTAALRWLGLARNSLDSGVLRYITESRHLQLNYLDVRGNNFTPSGIAALKSRFPDAVIQV
ncbi:MAG: hypothetical protein C0467_25670 [Planctomycetaceae bacterium]|nr:hypothetical protein [Planctomycetaceae bacterium]